MQKKLGTRIASGLLAALMFAQTVATTGITAFAADAASSSNYLVDDAQTETSGTSSLALDDGSEGNSVNEKTENDDGTGQSSSDASSSSTAPEEATPSPVPTAVPGETEPTTTPGSETPNVTPTPTPETTVEPTATPTAEPTATPTPTPSATPAPEESEQLDSVKSMMEQLPASVDEVANYDEEQSNALRQLCDSLQFAINELSDEEAAQIDLAYVDEVYEAVMTRLASLSKPASDFVPLAVAEDTDSAIQANVGDEVTMSVNLNRDDVAVTYQWQKWYSPEPDTVDDAVFDYTDADGGLTPTWYNYLVGDKTEAELLSENPDVSWQGMELWLAGKDALEAIGESADSLTFAWKTRNFAVDGFVITAQKTEAGVTLLADKGEEHYVGNLNDDGVYEFVSTQDNSNATIVWADIDGATDATYTHIVDENDRYITYRCKVTIVDEAYLAELDKYLETSDSETIATGETAVEEDIKENDVLYSSQKSLELPETMEAFSEKVAARFFSLARVSASGPYLSNDNQWIVGVNSNYEYITAEMYAQVQQWLAEGRITQAQADMYSEAAAYETLKKLSQSRKATEFITSLVIQYLADEAKGTETGETHPTNRQAFAVPTQTTVMPAMPKADDAIQKPKQAVEVPQVKNEPAEETHTAVVEENTAVDADDGVSQESIADVMAIFGY